MEIIKGGLNLVWDIQKAHMDMMVRYPQMFGHLVYTEDLRVTDLGAKLSQFSLKTFSLNRMLLIMNDC